MALPIVKVPQNSPQIAVVDSVTYGLLWCGKSAVTGLSFAFVPNWTTQATLTEFGTGLRLSHQVNMGFTVHRCTIVSHETNHTRKTESAKVRHHWKKKMVNSAPSKTPSAFVREEVPCCLDLLKVS